MFNKLIKNATALSRRSNCIIKKNTPELLIVAGVGGLIVSAVMACKNTMKLPDILEDMEESLEEIHDKVAAEEEKAAAENREPKINVGHETTMVYVNTGIKIAKLYALPIGLGVLSVLSIADSNKIMRQRNAALTAACVATDQAFKDYRSRVVEKFGEAADKELKHGIHEEEIEETTVDGKGKEKKVTKKIKVADLGTESPYVKYLTRTNPFWENDEQLMLFNIKAKQNYLNDRLHVMHSVTLNEAYEELGFKRTKAGMVCGWTDEHISNDGDGFIQFDVTEVCVVNENGGYERAYAIDFNVDGCIYEKM